MTYPSQQHPYSPPPGYPAPAWQQPGGYRPLPRKNRTALIVSVVAVVLIVVGALAITGFVAPGFLLSDEPKPAAGASQPTDQPQLDQMASDPQTLAEAIVAALKAKDAAALDRLFCTDATEDAKSIAQALPMVTKAELDGDVSTKSGTEAAARITITANGRTVTFTSEFASADGAWCWRGVAMSGMPEQSPEEKASVEAARKVAQQFLTAIKRGDKAKALSTFCEKQPDVVKRMIDAAIDGNADMRITKIPGRGSGGPIGVLVSGTISGRPSEGTVMTDVDKAGKRRCVASYLFS